MVNVSVMILGTRSNKTVNIQTAVLKLLLVHDNLAIYIASQDYNLKSLHYDTTASTYTSMCGQIMNIQPAYLGYKAFYFHAGQRLVLYS